MARQASVRLTLEGSQFLAQTKRAGEAVSSMAARAGRDLRQHFGAGADAAKRSMSGLAGSLKTAIGYAASFGGAFTVGTALRDAAKLQTTYRQVAFGVRDASGAMLKAADVQRISERAAAATGKRNEEMAASFKSLLDATGDLDFSRQVLEAVGTTSLATGDSLETMTDLADQLHTKFGVAGDDMLATFAKVFGAAKQGGPTLAQFAEVSSAVGAELLAAGIDGERGLNFMLGALVATDDRLKSLPKQVTGLKAVLRGLGEAGELKKLAEKIGIDPKKLINEPDAIARLKRIFGAGQKGVDALLGSMRQGEERETMQILFVDPFEAALEQATKAGFKGKAATEEALRIFDAGLERLGKSQMTGAQLQEEANRARNEPEAKLNEALNRLQNAFSRPEIIKAIDELTAHLPALADIVAKVVGFAAKHPVAAGAAAIGGKVALDAAGDVAGSALGAAGTAIVKKLLGKKAVEGAAGAAGSVAKGALPRVAGLLGMGGGAAGAGGAAAGGASALGALAGPLAAIAIGGAAGAYEVNKRYSDEDAVMRELQDATNAGGSGGTVEAKRAQLERLRKAFSDAGNAEIGESMFDSFARTVTGVDSRKTAADQMALAGDVITRLEQQIARLENPTGRKPAAEKAAEEKPKPVVLDQTAPRLIAEAVKNGLDGITLNATISSGPGIGRIYTGGGSRGPMSTPPARPGGGVT